MFTQEICRLCWFDEWLCGNSVWVGNKNNGLKHHQCLNNETFCVGHREKARKPSKCIPIKWSILSSRKLRINMKIKTAKMNKKKFEKCAQCLSTRKQNVQYTERFTVIKISLPILISPFFVYSFRIFFFIWIALFWLATDGFAVIQFFFFFGLPLKLKCFTLSNFRFIIRNSIICFGGGFATYFSKSKHQFVSCRKKNPLI